MREVTVESIAKQFYVFVIKNYKSLRTLKKQNIIKDLTEKKITNKIKF